MTFANYISAPSRKTSVVCNEICWEPRQDEVKLPLLRRSMLYRHDRVKTMQRRLSEDYLQTCVYSSWTYAGSIIRCKCDCFRPQWTDNVFVFGSWPDYVHFNVNWYPTVHTYTNYRIYRQILLTRVTNLNNLQIVNLLLADRYWFVTNTFD